MHKAALLVFVICFLATVGSTYRFVGTIDHIDRVKAATLANHNLMVTLLNAETGQRGYIITADPGYLIPYTTAVNHIALDITSLRLATHNDAANTAHVEQIVMLVDEKIAELAHTLSIRDTQGLLATAEEVKQHLGKNLMDNIRLHCDALELQLETKFVLEENAGTMFGRVAFMTMIMSLLSGSFLMFSNRKQK